MNKMDGSPAIQNEPTIEERLAKLERRCAAYEDTLRLINTAFGVLADSQQHVINHAKGMRQALAALGETTDPILKSLEDVISRLRVLEGKEPQW